ncbi:MAG: LTA synthase family protein [Oscillospiraceae bacterium]|nr:LTA synthase family protein [Oscillospiraceae bacterium]
MKNTKLFKRFSRNIIWGWPLLLVSLVSLYSARWYLETYGQLGFAAVLFTLGNNLSGTQTGLITAYFRDGFLPAFLWSLPAGFLLFYRSDVSVNLTFFSKWKLRLYPCKNWFSGAVAVIVSLALLYGAADRFGIIEYAMGAMNTSTLYEDEYVFPEDASIRFPEKKRNLIYIFIESAEVTFLSEEQGGALQHDVVPEMYALARDNVNFSDNEGVGGGYSMWGSTWTVGGMVAQTAGVPLRSLTGIGGNDTGANGEAFLPGLTGITDILHENGYYQMLMVGSDGSFGGRNEYYTQHGVDRVCDLFTAYEDGIVPEGYYVWWGMEDRYLYEYARQEITRMAQGDQPFAFTMLTVDTHHVGGYPCALCGSEFDQQYENVFACTSRQLNEFVEWIRQQDFYEDTAIVISGDHPTMDAAFINENVESPFSRRVYNCFINSAAEPVSSKNRVFSTMDMFPTTLAAMGCEIPGQRLGLGVNLFSAEPTLMERYGYDALDAELAANTPFYNYIFIHEYELN